MLAAELVRDSLDDLFGLNRRVIGGGQRCVVWKPDGDVGEILNVGGHERCLEARGTQPTERDETERYADRPPPVFERDRAQTIVEPTCASFTALLDRNLITGTSPQQERPKQRNERHRYEPRCDQCAGHHDRQAANEIARLSGEQEKREVRDNVR